jgi:hypothetical protein
MNEFFGHSVPLMALLAGLVLLWILCPFWPKKEFFFLVVGAMGARVLHMPSKCSDTELHFQPQERNSFSSFTHTTSFALESGLSGLTGIRWSSHGPLADSTILLRSPLPYNTAPRGVWLTFLGSLLVLTLPFLLQWWLLVSLILGRSSGTVTLGFSPRWLPVLLAPVFATS